MCLEKHRSCQKRIAVELEGMGNVGLQRKEISALGLAISRDYCSSPCDDLPYSKCVGIEILCFAVLFNTVDAKQFQVALFQSCPCVSSLPESRPLALKWQPHRDDQHNQNGVGRRYRILDDVVDREDHLARFSNKKR